MRDKTVLYNNNDIVAMAERHGKGLILAIHSNRVLTAFEVREITRHADWNEESIVINRVQGQIQSILWLHDSDFIVL
jgi:hypothetical protein